MNIIQTEQNYNTLKEMFGKELLRYINPFTDHDKVMTGKILEATLWTFAFKVKEPITFPAYFGKILHHTHDCAYRYIKTTPGFDVWADWKKIPTYYPLNDPSLTLLHKKLFCFYYYRKAEYSDLAKHFGITPDETREKVYQTFRSINQKMNARMDRIKTRLAKVEKQIESH